MELDFVENELEGRAGLFMLLMVELLWHQKGEPGRERFEIQSVTISGVKLLSDSVCNQKVGPKGLGSWVGIIIGLHFTNWISVFCL